VSRPIAPDDPGPVRPVAHAAAMGRGTATTITGQLVGRWLAELAQLIRNQEEPDLMHLVSGRWELLTQAERIRLTEIGYELLVRLDGVGALVAGSTQRLVPLVRDHTGRPLTSAVTERPRAGVPQGICTCGEPQTLGTVHRIGAPCYIAEPGDGVPQVEAPQAGAEDAE
jgi:hypothetical protein